MKSAIRKTGCWKLLLTLAGVLALLSLAPPVRADYVFWTGGDGNWSEGANWNTGSPPPNSFEVIIYNTSGSPWTITYNNASGGAQTFFALTLDATGTGSAVTLSQTGPYTLQSGDEYIGYLGTGVYTQSGGTNKISNGLFLGYLCAGSGAYNLSGSGSLSGNYEYIGYNNKGTFTQSGGINQVAFILYLGTNAGSSGRRGKKQV